MTHNMKRHGEFCLQQLQIAQVHAPSAVSPFFDPNFLALNTGFLLHAEGSTGSGDLWSSFTTIFRLDEKYLKLLKHGV